MKFATMMHVTLGVTLTICLWAIGCAKGGEGPVNCPSMAPPPMNQTGPCCYRSSNATRLDTPTFRIASLKVVAPPGILSSSIVNTFMQSGFDTESDDQLIRVDATGPGPVQVNMGIGFRHPDGTFSFFPRNSGGEYKMTGTLDGEILTTMPFQGAVKIAENDPGIGQWSLLIHGFTILRMPMTENRSCVGFRTTRWNTAEGGVAMGYVRVVDAVTLRSPLDTVTVCNMIAGLSVDGMDCSTTPQALWPTPPDSLCAGTTGTICTSNTTGTDVCDPGTPEGSTGAGGKPGCNAWKLVAQFTAQGVEII